LTVTWFTVELNVPTVNTRNTKNTKDTKDTKDTKPGGSRCTGRRLEGKNRRIEGRRIRLAGRRPAAAVWSETTIRKHKHHVYRRCLCFRIVVPLNRA
jgi:hypothetical protein